MDHFSGSSGGGNGSNPGSTSNSSNAAPLPDSSLENPHQIVSQNNKSVSVYDPATQMNKNMVVIDASHSNPSVKVKEPEDAVSVMNRKMR